MKKITPHTNGRILISNLIDTPELKPGGGDYSTPLGMWFPNQDSNSLTNFQQHCLKRVNIAESSSQ